MQQHNVDLSYDSQLRAPRAVGVNKATGKEMPVEESKRDQMMGPGENPLGDQES